MRSSLLRAADGTERRILTSNHLSKETIMDLGSVMRETKAQPVGSLAEEALEPFKCQTSVGSVNRDW